MITSDLRTLGVVNSRVENSNQHPQHECIPRSSVCHPKVLLANLRHEVSNSRLARHPAQSPAVFGVQGSPSLKKQWSFLNLRAHNCFFQSQQPFLFIKLCLCLYTDMPNVAISCFRTHKYRFRHKRSQCEIIQVAYQIFLFTSQY